MMLIRRIKNFAQKLKDRYKYGKVCEECRMHNGYHKENCSFIDGKAWQKLSALYKEAYEHARRHGERRAKVLQDKLNLLQGKYEILRRENNALRKRIGRHEKSS